MGYAEMEKEIQRTINKSVGQTLEREFEEQVELDELELEEYIEFVVKEVRRTSEH
jgi:hypothetical protein